MRQLIVLVTLGGCAHGSAAERDMRARTAAAVRMRQRDCQQSATHLRQDAPRPADSVAIAAYHRAINLQQNCPQQDTIFPAVWRVVPENASMLTALVYASSGQRDLLMLDALRNTAADAGRPTRVRLAALTTLTALSRPGWFSRWPAEQALPADSSITACAVSNVVMSHFSTRPGRIPLSDDSLRSSVRRFIATLSVGAEPREFRYATRCIFENVRHWGNDAGA